MALRNDWLRIGSLSHQICATPPLHPALDRAVSGLASLPRMRSSYLSPEHHPARRLAIMPQDVEHERVGKSMAEPWPQSSVEVGLFLRIHIRLLFASGPPHITFWILPRAIFFLEPTERT